jgi:NAD(P)-dependent dehydrogenase (short-subunit alcohol dehydrogenase family)
MTEYVLRNGDIAVATLRKPEAIADISSRYSADKLLVLKVDVRNKQDIANAFAKTKETFGRIDFVFNNAVYHIVSENSGSEARDMSDVSFWGAVNVTKLAVKFLREANPPGVGGCILQMSFVKGHEPDPSLESCNAA